MKTTVTIDAMRYNMRCSLQKEFIRYTHHVQEYADKFGTAVPTMDMSEFAPQLDLNDDDDSVSLQGSGASVAGSGASVAGSAADTTYNEEQKRLIQEVHKFRFRSIRDINEMTHLN